MLVKIKKDEYEPLVLNYYEKVNGKLTEKASKTYYANSSKLIREKTIKSRNADYKYQRDVDKLIKIMSESDSWLFKYKDLVDMVQGDE